MTYVDILNILIESNAVAVVSELLSLLETES